MAISVAFIRSFVRETERRWEGRELDRRKYGFQFVPGTKWNPGLPETTIRKFASKMRATFPDDFVTLLSCVNGTDKHTVDLRGDKGEPHRYGLGVYTYPRDSSEVRERLAVLKQDWKKIIANLEDEGAPVDPSSRFVPFFGHRYVLCAPDPAICMVCSIYGHDAIVYGRTLEEYLEAEFLRN